MLWLGPSREPRFFYLLFPPSSGSPCAAGCAGRSSPILGVQVGLIGVLHLRRFPEHVLEFQLLLLSLALVGLFLGIAVAERARARDALARSESELRTTFETAPDGLVTLDAAGRVASANPAACTILGLPAARLVGASLGSLVPGFPGPPGRAARRRARRGRGPTASRSRSRSRSAPRPGPAVHIVTLRDVTRRRQTEEKLRRKEEELTTVLRFAAAGQVASSLAHELNQPLYALSTYVQACQLLAQAPGGDRAQLVELMEKAVREVARAGDVVRRLREFFRTGGARLEPVPVRRLLDAAAEGTRRRLERHRIALSISCADGVGEVTCDALQLEIVLHNLVGNAIDAIASAGSERREIRLSARAPGRPGGAPGRGHRTGAPGGGGGPPLRALHDHEAGRDGARPLHLAVHRRGARRLAPRRAAPGRLRRLPLDPAGSPGGRVTPDETTPKVFVVEDDDAVRNSLQVLLGLEGLATEGFASAEAFLESWRPAWTGCLVVDLRMPGLSGLELLARLRELGCALPAIVITAHGDVSSTRSSFRAGAVDFFEKPVDNQALLAAIRQALDRAADEARDAAERAQLAERLGRLSARERAVLDLVAAGRHNREIAATLAISPRTVEVYKARMMEKLQVRRVPDLVRLVLRARDSGR